MTSNLELIAKLESVVAELEMREKQSVHTSFKTMLARDEIKKAIMWLKGLGE